MHTFQPGIISAGCWQWLT